MTRQTVACQALLSSTISWTLLKFMSIDLVMLSHYLILCCSFLLCLQSFTTSVFFNELTLHIRWLKCWNFSFSISLSSEYSGFISFRIDWFDLLAIHETQKSSPAPQLESISSSALCLLYSPTLTFVLDYRKNHSFDYLGLY